MCGRYVFIPNDDFAMRFNLKKLPPLEKNYNVTPTMLMPIITNTIDHKVNFKKWGLAVSWGNQRTLLINIRSETVLEKEHFNKLFAHNRCLVPNNGFYEWQKTTHGKQPYYISLPQNKPCSFAGIYEQNEFSILTCAANDTVKPIHNRMPIILKPSDESLYLNPQTSLKVVHDLCQPYNEALISCRVGKATPNNNAAKLLKRNPNN